MRMLTIKYRHSLSIDRYMGFLLIFALILSLQLFARDIPLFDEQNQPSDRYVNDIIYNGLEKRDVFILEDGHKVTFRQELGQGGTTIVSSVKEQENGKIYALRLPFPSERFSIVTARSFISNTLSLRFLLDYFQVPSPAIYDFQDFAYILVEQKNIKFTMDKFLNGVDDNDRIIAAEAEEALYEFARQTAHVSFTADFHFEQIGYDYKEKKWFLLDWSDGFGLAKSVEDDQFFYNESNNIWKFALNRRGYPIPVGERNGRILYKVRTLSEREQKIKQKLHKVVTEERIKISEMDTHKLLDIYEVFSKAKTADEMLAAYELLEGRHLKSFYSTLANIFVRDHLPVLIKSDISLDELLQLRHALYVDDWSLYKTFIESIFPKVENLSDLYKVLVSNYVIPLTEKVSFDEIQHLIDSHIINLANATEENVITRYQVIGLTDSDFLSKEVENYLLSKFHSHPKRDDNCIDVMKEIL